MEQMRRKDRELNAQQAWEIIDKGEYGFLATSGQDGQPYGVPLSYERVGDAIYFHSSSMGHKVRNLQQNSRVSFCVVGWTQPVYNGNFTTFYESAIAFGEVHLVEDLEEKAKSLYRLCEKYLPDKMEHAPEEIARAGKVTAVYRIDVTGISGKASMPKPE